MIEDAIELAPMVSNGLNDIAALPRTRSYPSEINLFRRSSSSTEDHVEPTNPDLTGDQRHHEEVIIEQEVVLTVSEYCCCCCCFPLSKSGPGGSKLHHDRRSSAEVHL
jgi:hypothetical protein